VDQQHIQFLNGVSIAYREKNSGGSHDTAHMNPHTHPVVFSEYSNPGNANVCIAVGLSKVFLIQIQR
jgi:hypothetical protein